MNAESCRFEEEVRQLAAADRWLEHAGPELQAHVAVCPVCEETACISQAVAGAPAPDLRLPDSVTIWRRAAWDARQAAVRRAVRPVLVAQAAAAAAMLAVLALGIGWLSGRTEWLTLFIDASLGGRDWTLAAGRTLLERTGALADHVSLLVTTRLAGYGWIASSVAGAAVLGVVLVAGLSRITEASRDAAVRR